MSAGKKFLFVGGVVDVAVGAFLCVGGLAWKSPDMAAAGLLLMVIGVIVITTRHLFFPLEAT